MEWRGASFSLVPNVLSLAICIHPAVEVRVNGAGPPYLKPLHFILAALLV